MLVAMGLKILWGVVGLAMACVVVSVLTIIDYSVGGDDNARDATFGFLFMAALLGIPGGIALVRARARAAHARLLEQLEGYVRSRDAIDLADLSRAIDRNELDSEALLLELIQNGKADLVFHQDRNEYLHRARIRHAHTFFDKCNSCGAAIRARVIFPGEDASCEYCNVPLSIKDS